MVIPHLQESKIVPILSVRFDSHFNSYIFDDRSRLEFRKKKVFIFARIFKTIYFSNKKH